MKHRILIVDDDQDLLLILKESLESYNNSYEVLISGSVQNALIKLQSESVSLLISDLRMPGIDGFTLLTYVNQNYPDLPVIIMTGYPYKDVDRMSYEKGAIGFISKPFKIQELEALIRKTLQKQTEGGTLHDISIPLFLQMIEMEQKTATVRVLNRATEKRGVLFFKNGELLDARLDNTSGLTAAREIISWDDVSISIENSCNLNQRNIQVSLNALILEAMRVKDERPKSQQTTGTETPNLRVTPDKTNKVLTSVQAKLKNAFLGRWIPNASYVDNSWGKMIKSIQEISSSLNFGDLKALYLERKRGLPLAIVPDEEIVVLELDSTCSRDKLLRVLSL